MKRRLGALPLCESNVGRLCFCLWKWRRKAMLLLVKVTSGGYANTSNLTSGDYATKCETDVRRLYRYVWNRRREAMPLSVKPTSEGSTTSCKSTLIKARDKASVRRKHAWMYRSPRERRPRLSDVSKVREEKNRRMECLSRKNRCLAHKLLIERLWTSAVYLLYCTLSCYKRTLTNFALI